MQNESTIQTFEFQMNAVFLKALYENHLSTSVFSDFRIYFPKCLMKFTLPYFTKLFSNRFFRLFFFSQIINKIQTTKMRIYN